MSAIPERLAAALADRYRLERELGQGGMATVYLAEDLRHHRRVAIKVLRPELAAVLGADRFVQEITTTASLQHPHILPLFDSGTADGFLYYVMPYVEGETLRDKLNREKQLGVDVAVKLTTEVADALDYAHRHGVIHRDIKPENILLHDGRPMVADFGIALAVSAAAGGRMTETGLSLGTPHYMSPEQATAEKEITARSDVYSLASVLYEMLSGDPPHTASTAQAVILQIVAEDVTPVQRRRKAVPSNVAAALAKALQKLPADRFDSAQSFAAALANPAFGLGEAERVLSRRNRWFERRTAVPWALTAVLTVLLTWSYARSWRSGPPAEPVRFEIPLSDSGNVQLGGRPDIQGPHPLPTRTSVAFSPTGDLIAFTGCDGAGGPAVACFEHAGEDYDVNRNSRIFLRRLDQSRAEALAGTEGASTPFFSPDGARIGFFVANTAVEYGGVFRRVSIADGSVETIASDSTIMTPHGAAWTEDDMIVYGTRDGLYQVPASGGVPTRLAEPGPGALYLSQPYPIGRKAILAHTVSPDADPTRARIVAIHRDSRARDTLLANGMNPVFVPPDHLVFLREGTLMAVRFDARRLVVLGEPVTVASGIMQEILSWDPDDWTGAGQLAWSAAGHLVYALGPLIIGSFSGRSMPYAVVRITPQSGRADRGANDGTIEPFFPERAGYNPWLRVSPDGNRVAYAVADGRNISLFIRDLRRGSTRRLETGAFYNVRPVWSPHGDSLLFRADSGDGVLRTYRMSVSDPREPQLVDSIGPVFDWSSRGVVAHARNGDVWMRTPDGTSAPFFTSPVEESGARFSPDGDWVVYEAGEIFVRPYPGPGIPVQISTGSGRKYAPKWAANGRRIIYANSSRGLIAVDVVPGNPFVAGRESVYNSRGFGLAEPLPDGSMIGRPTPDGETMAAAFPPARKLQVILNFAELLRRRVRD